jgi:hypothetical protein
MKPFKNLSYTENEALLNLPVYISLLAANGDGKMDEAEKMSAVQFSHTKTFSGGPLLAEYFRQADIGFGRNLEEIGKGLPMDTAGREEAIRSEIVILEKIVLKLGKRYSSAIRRSMKAFAIHVAKAHHSVLVDFIFPVPIPGLTE